MQMKQQSFKPIVFSGTYFVDLHAEGRLLSCDQSLDRLIGLLEKNNFDSGSHIDYYDLTDEGGLLSI